MNNSNQVTNLVLNTKWNNKDRKKDSNKVVIPINTAFFLVSLKGTILLSHVELKLSTSLIAKPNLLPTSSKLPSLNKASVQLFC